MFKIIVVLVTSLIVVTGLATTASAAPTREDRATAKLLNKYFKSQHHAAQKIQVDIRRNAQQIVTTCSPELQAVAAAQVQPVYAGYIYKTLEPQTLRSQSLYKRTLRTWKTPKNASLQAVRNLFAADYQLARKYQAIDYCAQLRQLQADGYAPTSIAFAPVTQLRARAAGQKINETAVRAAAIRLRKAGLSKSLTTALKQGVTFPQEMDANDPVITLLSATVDNQPGR